MLPFLRARTEDVANRLGAVAANLMSAGARVLGYVIYGALRVVYRRRERIIAMAAALAIAAGLLAWWLL